MAAWSEKIKQSVFMAFIGRNYGRSSQKNGKNSGKTGKEVSSTEKNAQ